MEQAFDGKIWVKEVKDIGVTGNFEVVVDGDLVWSKKSRDQGFPTTDAQVDTIIAHIKARQKVLIPPKTNQMSTEKAEVNIQY